MHKCTILLAVAACAGAQHPASPAELDDVNRAIRAATLGMDNPAVLALWDDDGVSLLPGQEPLIGKPAIAAFLQRATASLGDAHMRSFEMTCDQVVIAGDLASEICREHQIVDLGGGKPPFDGRGTLLFVLRRHGTSWRLLREAWISGA